MSDEPAAKPDGPTGDAEDRIARARARRLAAMEDDDVPKLPRGKGIRGVSRGQWIKITLTAGLLVMLLVIQKPCANSVSSFVTSFDDPGSAASKMPKPGNVDGTEGGSGSNSVLIRPDMSEAEMKAALERAGLKPKAGSGSGVGSNTAGSGSGAGSNTDSGSGSGVGSNTAGSGSGAGSNTAGSGSSAGSNTAGSGSSAGSN